STGGDFAMIRRRSIRLGLEHLEDRTAPALFGPFAADNVGLTPNSVVTGDFNGDGRPDLVTSSASNNNVTVLVNNNGAGFVTMPAVAVGSNPYVRAAGDFNDDGRLDVVVSNQSSSTVSVLLGNGGGQLYNAPGSPLTGFNTPAGIAVADFNRDGKPDLMV